MAMGEDGIALANNLEGGLPAVALSSHPSFSSAFINPEKIIIGGVFMRSNDLLLPTAMKEIEKEAFLFGICCRDIPCRTWRKYR